MAEARGHLASNLVPGNRLGFAGFQFFGSAPKFPRPSLVELCLLHNRASGDAGALTMGSAVPDINDAFTELLDG